MIKPLDFRQHPDGTQAFTTLRGTTDPGNPYSQLNCCDYTGDEPNHWQNCRKGLCNALQIPENSLILPHQTHGTEIAVIDTDFLNAPTSEQTRRLEGIDGLVTRLPHIAIGVYTADCVPVLLCDPVAGLIAAAHAGWKGTVGGIAARTVNCMAALGASPARTQVLFGPAICRDCFEVGNEVSDLFQKTFPETGIIFRNPHTGKAHIDLIAANIFRLIQTGIRPSNISDICCCTKCRPDLFFSARQLGVKSGRIVTGILRTK